MRRNAKRCPCKPKTDCSASPGALPLDRMLVKLNNAGTFRKVLLPTMLRTAFLILSGNTATSALLFARNLIVARLIPVSDYGVAATFAVAMAVVEMTSTLGLQQQIVQAKEGDDPRFQAGLQGFQVLRGVAAGGLLFLLAGPMAAYFGIPEAAWAYQVLAVVPVLGALQHFDVHRLNRQMVFGPLILSKLMPALIALLAIWPLAIWFGDWQVMLWSIILQAAAGALASHVVAQTPYRLVFDRAVMVRSLRFGWPILVNTFLMFLVFQGDKLIVGRELGMEALALFAMGMTLTLTPTLILAGSSTNFFLPRLASLDRAIPAEAARFDSLAIAVLQLHLAFGLFLVLAICLLGAPLIGLLLGSKYHALVPFLLWLAILQAFRAFKGGPSTLALARGRTENAMFANLPRVALLPLAWWAAVSSGDVHVVIWIAILAEFMGFLIALALVRGRIGISLRRLTVPIATTFFCLALASIIALEGSNQGTILPALPLLGLYAGLAVAVLASTLTMSDLLRLVQEVRKGVSRRED